VAKRPGGGGAAERGPGVEAAAVDDRAAAEDDRASRGPAVEGTSEEEGNRAGTYISQRP